MILPGPIDERFGSWSSFPRVEASLQVHVTVGLLPVGNHSSKFFKCWRVHPQLTLMKELKWYDPYELRVDNYLAHSSSLSKVDNYLAHSSSLSKVDNYPAHSSSLSKVDNCLAHSSSLSKVDNCLAHSSSLREGMSKSRVWVIHPLFNISSRIYPNEASLQTPSGIYRATWD